MDKAPSRVAIVALPERNTPVEGAFNNFHGYWEPPPCVLSFWSGACLVAYEDEETHSLNVWTIHWSYNQCLDKYYRENAL